MLESFAKGRLCHSRYVDDGVKMGEFVTRYARSAGIIIALALVFAWLGVYETGERPFLLRFLFWLPTLGVGAVTAIFVVPWAFETGLQRWPTAARILVAAALISVPVWALLVAIDSFDGQPLPLQYWPLQYVYVLVISVLVTTGGWFAGRLEDAEAAAETAGADPRDAFLERLPVKYRGAALYAVSSEDHYLRVHTDRGEALILMRLADAVRELDGADGLQTHRSWWVAREGVADTRRSGGRLGLILKSGAEAPVSRTYAKAVREAGLAE